MKTKITTLILLAFMLSGCFTTAGVVFGGLNVAYNGLQEYREFKKNVKEVEPVTFPPDPWAYLTHCSCDSGAYCLSDQDYIQIIRYNAALRSKSSAQINKK